VGLYEIKSEVCVSRFREGSVTGQHLLCILPFLKKKEVYINMTWPDISIVLQDELCIKTVHSSLSLAFFPAISLHTDLISLLIYLSHMIINVHSSYSFFSCNFSWQLTLNCWLSLSFCTWLIDLLGRRTQFCFDGNSFYGYCLESNGTDSLYHYCLPK
jgi:hypothetical protein